MDKTRTLRYSYLTLHSSKFWKWLTKKKCRLISKAGSKINAITIRDKFFGKLSSSTKSYFKLLIRARCCPMNFSSSIYKFLFFFQLITARNEYVYNPRKKKKKKKNNFPRILDWIFNFPVSPHRIDSLLFSSPSFFKHFTYS